MKPLKVSVIHSLLPPASRKIQQEKWLSIRSKLRNLRNQMVRPFSNKLKRRKFKRR
jgi:hypothetical protein